MSRPSTRALSNKFAKLDEAQKQIKRTQLQLANQQAEVDSLLDEIQSSGASDQLPAAPTWQHAEEAFVQISLSTDGMTQNKAADLLQKGELPGKFFGQKVRMSQRYLSAYKVKLDSGATIKNNKGRPMMLDEFQLSFINSVIEYGQARNKAQLQIQVAMLVRLMMLIDHGYAHVDELDKRITTNPAGKKRRKRSRPDAGSLNVENAANQADQDDEDSGNETEDDIVPDAVNQRARDEAFDSLKQILGESLSKHLMLPNNYRYPCKRSVQRLCKSQNWGIRKGQQQTSHRFDGATPVMLDAWFECTLRAYIQWDIDTPSQKHNCDEKHICCEFEQSGRLVKVIVQKRPSGDEDRHAGKGRVSGCKSAPDRSIVGLTNFPFIGADNKTTTQIYIRKAASARESASVAAQHEQEILDAVKDAYAAEGIAVYVLTTETGYQNQDSFKKSMCYFIRDLFKKEGVDFTFRDERNPSMRELGRLGVNHLLFLDNASCHDLACDLFRLECLSHGIVLLPAPPNTTNITQPLDQHVNKLFTLWMRQFFLRQIEMEIVHGRSGFQNELQMTLWATQLKEEPNAAVFNMPGDMILDLRKEYNGNPTMLNLIASLNSVCEHSALAGTRFTTAKVARLSVGPWLAALKYARESFVCCGLASPAFTSQVETRRGPLLQVRHEMDAALLRYELYPERVKNTPIAKAAAEVALNRAANAATDKLETCKKAAQLLNMLPRLAGDIQVRSADVSLLAVESAKFCFGEEASGSAISLACTLFQARELLLAEQKKQNAEATYRSTMPPSNIADLESIVNDQQSHLRASNAEWVSKKATALAVNCQAALKAKDIFCSSLTKLITKQLDMVEERRTWTAAIQERLKTKWKAAWRILKASMLLVRDGKDQAPKRKSAATRFQDLVDLKSAIVAKKDKLVSKGGAMCVEIASLNQVLTSHASDYGSVEAAVQDAQDVLNTFEQGCVMMEADPDAVDVVLNGEENVAAIAGAGLDNAQNNNQ